MGMYNWITSSSDAMLSRRPFVSSVRLLRSLFTIIKIFRYSGPDTGLQVVVQVLVGVPNRPLVARALPPR